MTNLWYTVIIRSISRQIRSTSACVCVCCECVFCVLCVCVFGCCVSVCVCVCVERSLACVCVLYVSVLFVCCVCECCARVCVCVLCKQQLQSFQQCALYYLLSLNFLFHRRWKLLHRSVLLIFPIDGIRYFIPFLPQNNVIGIQHSEPQCSPRSASATSRFGFGTTRKACIICKLDKRSIILWNWIHRNHKHLFIQQLANIHMTTTCTATSWPCS